MSFNNFLSYLDAPTHRTRTVYTAVLDDVLFCPTNNVITTPDRTLIEESAGPGKNTIEVSDGAITSTDQVESIDGFCTAFRCSFSSYYHLLIDNLSRFDLLNLPYFSRFDNINLLCPGGLRPLEEYFLSKLLPSNVTVVPLEENVLYKPDKYVFLSFPTRRASAYIPGPFVDRLRTRTLRRDAPDRTRRLYISRRKTSIRRVENEDSLMEYLRPLGFERHTLEDYPPSQQIELFEEAEVVVGPHGAGLSNLLFSTDATVLELQPSTNVATHYYLLCKRMGHDYHYLTHDAPTIDSDFSTDPKTLVEHLDSIMN